MRKFEIAVAIIGVAGLLFSGYLSAIKFFTKTCAFSESCPYFLGYPACYYGFAMYLVITLFAVLRVSGKCAAVQANSIILATSVLGILFAGYFTVGELPVLFNKGFSAYILGLPTCALGLIFYIVVCALSLKLRKGNATSG